MENNTNVNNTNVNNTGVTLDNAQATRETIDEKRKDLAGNQRIIETKPGEFHTLERMNG